MKTLVNDRVARDDCLLGFTSWCDRPRVFMYISDATVSLKAQLNKVCYKSLYIQELHNGLLSLCKHRNLVKYSGILLS